MRISALGPLRAYDRDGAPVDLGGPKQRAVLAVLLAAGERPVSVDRIIAEVWGSHPPASARHTTQVYVSELRKLVPGAIERVGVGYLLRLEPARFDVPGFEARVTDARERLTTDPAAAAVVAAEALAMWHGTPYEDTDGGEMLAGERTRLEHLLLGAAKTRVEGLMGSGRAADGAAELGPWLRSHPFDEEFRSFHMLALYRAGRQAEALRSFTELREILAEELGIDPSPDLQALEDRILTQDPSLNVASATTAPAPPPESEDHSQDLIGLALVAPSPVHVSDAVTVLGLDEGQVVALVERLAEQGMLVESGAGFTVGGLAPAVSVGPTRRSSLAGRLADVIDARNGPAAEIGRLHLQAGRLTTGARWVATAARASSNASEAIMLAELALEAGERDELLDPREAGELHFLLGVRHREMGESVSALEHLDHAARLLRGERRVDAMGFAAAVADDLQQPSRSEWLAALAQVEAKDHPAKSASLLTLQGRQLSRIGFPAEADTALEKGETLLEGVGGSQQRYHARLNQAWVALDRGEMRKAEALFARIRAESSEVDGEIGQLTQAAYWARAAFGVGRAAEARTVATEAAELAVRRGWWAPEFIAHLAITEGALAFERPADAVEAASAADGVAAEHLPAWRNRTLLMRAKAARANGDLAEARALLEQAFEASPPGSDGWRIRSLCRAFEMELIGPGAAWPAQEAAELTDELLQSRWFAPAIELLTLRAVRESSPALAVQAAGLAVQIGIPTAAARACAVAGRSNELAAVGRVVRSVEPPPEWADEWRSLPHVATALSLPEVAGSEDLLRRRIDEVLESSGLAGVDVVLSPAQRRAAGLVRRPARRSGLARRLAAVGGVVAVAAVTTVIVGSLMNDPVPTTTVSSTTEASTTSTTTTTIALEETLVPPPEDGLFGQALYRGGNGRSGVQTGRLDSVTGHYWMNAPGGFFTVPPVGFGKLLYIGSSTSDRLYALDQTTGNLVFQVETGDRIRGAPAVELIQGGAALVPSGTFLIFGSDDGIVYARDAFQAAVGLSWQTDVGAPVATSPVVVNTTIVVATEDGRVLGLDGLNGGDIVWSHPADGSNLGRIAASPAEADGIVYVVTAEGVLHRLDGETGEAVCEPEDLRTSVAVPPMVVDGAVYVPTEGGPISVFRTDACGGVPDNRQSFYPSSVPVTLSPAVSNDTMYLVESQRLLAQKLDPSTFDSADPSTQFDWLPFDAGDNISTSPVLGDGVVYLGTTTGRVIAIDAATGTELWEFQLETRVEALASVDNALFATTAGEEVWAIAGG